MTAQTLYDLVLTAMASTPRNNPAGRPIMPAAWNRAVAARVEADVSRAGKVILSRPRNPGTGHIEPAVDPRVATARHCIPVCAHVLGAEVEDILGDSRARVDVEARQITMHVVRQVARMSLVETGRMFGGRDHTTVLHACRRVAEKVPADEWWARRVEACMRAMGVEQVTLRPAAA